MKQQPRAAIARIHTTSRWRTRPAGRLPGLILAAGLVLCGTAAGARPDFIAFGGVMTDNPWEEIVLTPWKTRLQKPGFAGLGLGRPLGTGFDSRAGQLRFELEGQLVRHFHLQNHWEVNLPLNIRLTPPTRLFGLVDSLAYGIGPSYASRLPSFERKRGKGDVERLLVYWQVELERNLAGRPGSRVFAGLHHRSDAYETVGKGGSSNGLVVGFRRAL